MAVELGRRLFSDMRLSSNGVVSCATCHVQTRAFADGSRVSRGIADTDRNTPSVVYARWGRWFGWDGAADSLWAASIRPLLSTAEMGSSADHVARVIRSDPALSLAVDDLLGTGGTPGAEVASEEALLLVAAKAIAAFQETIVSARTDFDAYRDALRNGDLDALAAYPVAASRGLRVFVGRGRCVACHYGPRLTSGEFATVGIGERDGARSSGLEMHERSPYRRDGPFSDDPGAPAAHLAAAARAEDGDGGRVKIPTLRGVAETAPYMHDGSIATLEDVVRHYVSIDPSGLPRLEMGILDGVVLDPGDVDDIVAFLRTLSPSRTGRGGGSPG